MSLRSHLRVSLSGLLTAAALYVSGPVMADTAANRERAAELPPVPQRVEASLPKKARGAAALGHLKNTGRLAEWSSGYGMTASQAESMFARDPRAYVDRRGALMFVEHLETPPRAPASSQTPQQTVAPQDLAQVFNLHSRPDSKRKLYLDFDGHVTQGTAWNESYRVGTINSPAFDIDGVPGVFSDQEKAVIFGIWQRVKEDYAAFDIDVTTEEPPVDQMTRTNAQDSTFGVRVVITRDFTPGTSEGACQCGGFAYVGVFAMASETFKPAFVFYDNLSGSEKFVAEAVTHEAGHTMGLSHDGQGTLGYYEGHGTGVTGWAPIMGVGYSKLLTQWSKGEYSGANNREDDYLVMQNNGVTFAPDEHGNNTATATVLQPVVDNGRNRFTATGVIQGPLDIDFFRITAGGGLLNINVEPDKKDPNLDIVATLFNASGQQVAINNPVDALNSVIQFNVVSPGTYFLSVRGTGAGNPGTTGYSAYGSIGTYSVTALASLTAVTAAPPVARITANRLQGNTPLRINFSSTGTQGTTPLTYSWDFGDGTRSAVPTPPQKTYTAPGTYTVTLQVTDAAGQMGIATVNVNAVAPPGARSMAVRQMTLTGVVPNPARPDAFVRAVVTVVDSTGQPVRNARISGTWSGIVNSTVTSNVLTNQIGQVSVVSPSTPFVGTFTFTLTNVTANGFTYNPQNNAFTARSLTF